MVPITPTLLATKATRPIRRVAPSLEKISMALLALRDPPAMASIKKPSEEPKAVSPEIVVLDHLHEAGMPCAAR
jgi:hypothetical protein